jgi:hypothetical protein
MLLKIMKGRFSARNKCLSDVSSLIKSENDVADLSIPIFYFVLSSEE